jgi:S1-C subfamily serine protease
VLAYGERRIFQPTELQRATTAGKPGDRVPVWVLRDGERVRLHLELGPIGARLRSGRMLPGEPW